MRPAQIKSVKELIDAAKANPEKANYGSSAASFQFASELFNLRTGTKFVQIPYKGGNESSMAVASGDVMMTIADSSSVDALIKAGRIRPLASTGPQRAPAYTQCAHHGGSRRVRLLDHIVDGVAGARRHTGTHCETPSGRIGQDPARPGCALPAGGAGRYRRYRQF